MTSADLASVQTAPSAAAVPAAGKVYDPRTRRLIEGPIAPTLISLAAPNMLVMLAQSSVGLVETYFVGKLGTDPLAGVALVFPLLMLMQMMSAGAMGGGISSAIARALGGGRRDDANALALHAVTIALVFGLTFTVLILPGGRWLYSAMGGSGASLDAALTYSNVIFTGAILVWLFNSLSNVIRGTGNMAVPAYVTCVGVVVLIPLSPCLIFGLGPLPRLGVAGGAVAVLIYYAVGSLALLAYLQSSKRSVVRPSGLLASRYAGRYLPTSFASALSRRWSLSPQTSQSRSLPGSVGSFRAGCDRGLRNGVAAGIFADPLGVRSRRPAGRHGGHQHRRRPPRTGIARCMDRRGNRSRNLRIDRCLRRAISLRLAFVVRLRSCDD